MAFDGSVNIDSSIDGSGFSKGLEKFNSVAKGVIGAFAGLIGTAATALTGAAAAGVKYNSEMEQYITSFGTMLGGADKATAMVANLKKFAADTPFEFNDLAKGTQTLLAFGVSAKDIMPDLQRLGDVSQGNVDRFNALSLAFAQVSSAGKMQGQDLLQFVNAGFNPLNEMARTTGKSMAELRSEMEKGQISAQDVANAFKTATSKGGQFYQAMEAQSKTFNGQMSTLKDNATQFLGQITAGLQSSLKDTALPMVNAWMSELQTAFSSGGVQGVVGAFGIVLSKAVTAVAQQAPQMVGLGVTLIQSFLNGIRQSAPQLAAATVEIVGALANGIVSLAPSLGSAALALLTQFVNRITSAGPQISAAAGTVLQKFVSGTVAALPRLVSLATQLIVSLANDLSANAGQVVSGAQQIITVLAQALLQAAPQLASAAVQLMGAFFAALMQQNPPAAIFLGVIGAVKGVQEAFKGLDAAASAAKNIQESGGIFGAISSAANNAKENITTLKGVLFSIGGTFKTVGQGVAGLASSLAEGAAGFVKMGAQAVAATAKLVIQKGAMLASAAAEKIVTAAQWLLNIAMDANPIGIIIVAIAALVAAFLILWNTNKEFRDAVIAIWGAIVGFFTKTIPAAFNAVVNFFKQWGVVILAAVLPVIGIPLLIAQHWNQIVAFLQSIPGKIGYALGYALGTIVKWGMSLVNWAATAIPTFIGNVGAFFAQLPGKILAAVTTAFQNIANFGTGIITWAATAIPQFIGNVGNFFAQLPGKIGGAILSAFNGIKNWGGNMISWAATAIPNFIGSVVSFFVTLPGRIWNAIIGAVSGMARWGGQMLQTAQDAARSIIKGIVDFFTGLPNQMLNIGHNIVQGLWNGITGAWKMITDGVKNLTSGFVSGFKSALGIHSPSKLFRDEIGKMLPPGIAVGFESAMPESIRRMQAQAAKIIERIQLSIAAQQGNATYDAAAVAGMNISIPSAQVSLLLNADARKMGLSVTESQWKETKIRRMR